MVVAVVCTALGVVKELTQDVIAFNLLNVDDSCSWLLFMCADVSTVICFEGGGEDVSTGVSTATVGIVSVSSW